MHNAVKKTNNLSVSRPPLDLSVCAEHAPVLARSAGPYKLEDVFPIHRIKRRYQVLQHISQCHQHQSGKEQQQRWNNDQLLKKRGNWLLATRDKHFCS